MVNVNRHTLPQRELKKLSAQLDSTMGKLDSKQIGVFLGELLGPEEHLTMIKRMAAIVLLLEGYSEYKTARLLKLSPSTTEKIAKKIKTGAFDGILRIIGKNKTEYFTILKTIDSILHLGGALPHYNGLERYRGLR